MGAFEDSIADAFEASIADAYGRGVEAGRADAVPPDTEPMKWCTEHRAEWVGAFEPTPYRQCRSSKLMHTLEATPCVLEDPVAHWRTI